MNGWYRRLSEDYMKMLSRAYEKIPKKPTTGERFEMPKPNTIRIGGRTIIQNFGEVCTQLNRVPHHILKFLTKEMATAATFDGTRAVFQGKFGRESIARLLEIYVNRYVICPICRRPDTKVEKQGRFFFLVCEACGARSSVLPT